MLRILGLRSRTVVAQVVIESSLIMLVAAGIDLAAFNDHGRTLDHGKRL